MISLLAGNCAALALLLVFSFFFSAVETALLSLNAVKIHRIRKSRPKSADIIERILSAPKKLLSTVLIGNTVVNIAAAAVAYEIAESVFPGRGEEISIPTMTFLLVVLCDITPKRLAMSQAESVASVVSPLLSGLISFMTPLRVLLEGVAELLRKDLHAPKKVLSADEFRTVIEVGEEEGVLGQEERTMVDGILGLKNVQARQVMTPRVDLIGIDLDDPMVDREKIARTAQFRYLPVYKRSLDHPEGFLDVPRFLLSPDRNFQAAVMPPFFIPETATLDDLLATFRKGSAHVAFVVDEFGGTAGLVSRGDVLEEIVGDVENEMRPERLTIQKMAGNLWIVDGSASLSDVNYELEVNLHAENVDRISGWLNAQAGRIARTGEVVQAQGCKATVHRTRRNRTVTVFVEKISDGVATEGGGI